TLGAPSKLEAGLGRFGQSSHSSTPRQSL
ncbi:hypothetical protein BN1723_020247, partial [Verticillium longisporum]